jgi:hypothetical protein
LSHPHPREREREKKKKKIKERREMGSKVGFGWARLLTISLMVLVTEVRGQVKIFNVMNYSAVADGATDNSRVNSYGIACLLLVSLNFIESFFFFRFTII